MLRTSVCVSDHLGGERACACMCWIETFSDTNDCLSILLYLVARRAGMGRNCEGWRNEMEDIWLHGDLKWHLAKCQPPIHPQTLRFIRMCGHIHFYICELWLWLSTIIIIISSPYIRAHSAYLLYSIYDIRPLSSRCCRMWCGRDGVFLPFNRAKGQCFTLPRDTCAYVSRFGRLPR